MPLLRRAFAALWLASPAGAQVVQTMPLAPAAPVAAAPAAVSAALAPALASPGATLAPALAAPAAVSVSPVPLASILAAAPSAAPAVGSLADVAPAAATASGDDAKAGAAAPAPAPDAGRLVFDGALTTRSGSVFVPSPTPRPEFPGGRAFVRTQPAPTAPVKSVQNTQGLFGRPLLDRVTTIAARGQREHTYHEASEHLFSTADNHALGGVHGVADAYSGVFVPGTGASGMDYAESGDQAHDGWTGAQVMNVEHVSPQSYFGHALPMRADVHILMATLEHPNSVRGNLPYGVVKGTPDYRNDAGAKRGGGVFEPPDFTKGRVARAMLYFYARYRNEAFFDRRVAAFWNAQLETLLDWNRRFPPTVEERRRNDQVESFQGNRNPFVDDPGLADHIGLDVLRDTRAPSRVAARTAPAAPAPARRSDKPRKGKKRSRTFRRPFVPNRGRR